MYQNTNKGFLLLGIFIIFKNGILAQNYPHRCSNKLETALEHMMRRNQLKSGGRNSLDLSPYSIYQSFYGNDHDDRNQQERDHRRRSYEHNRARQNTILSQKLDDSFYETQTPNNFIDERNQLKKPSLPIARVEIAGLKVRLPNKARWVHVDKCQFSASNRSLDTRLIFPDLTISGKVIIHPTGGNCNMILRLRRAGIEFRTIPMDESRNQGGTVSVRTDSHFAEPGFLSVFAHGCEGKSGIKVRQNSKRRHFNNTPRPEATRYSEVNEMPSNTKDSIPDGSYRQDKSRYVGYNPNLQDNYYDDYRNIKRYSWHDQMHRRYDNLQDHFYDREFRGNNYQRRKRDDKSQGSTEDRLTFHEDILNFNDDNLQSDPNFKTYDDFFNGDGNLIFGGLKLPISGIPYHNSNKLSQSQRPSKWYNVNENINVHEFSNNNNAETAPGLSVTDTDEIGDALTSELEQLFSVGVRGMLTTYMKKALQPAIKETLMENMGYTVSYG